MNSPKSSSGLTPICATEPPVTLPDSETSGIGTFRAPLLTSHIIDDKNSEIRDALRVLDSERDSDDFSVLNASNALKQLIKDPYDSTRILVAECFLLMTMSSAGRNLAVENLFVADIVAMTDDDSEEVTRRCILALSNLTLTLDGAKAVVDAGAVSKLISNLAGYSLPTQDVCLRALASCFKVEDAERQGAEADGVKIVTGLLTMKNPRVRENAASVLMGIFKDREARVQTSMSRGTVRALLRACQDSNRAVKAKALGALMTVVSSDEAKAAFVKEDAVQKILPSLRESSPEILLNCLQALGALCEIPEARKVMLFHLRDVWALTEHPSSDIQIVAGRALTIINRTP